MMYRLIYMHTYIYVCSKKIIILKNFENYDLTTFLLAFSLLSRGLVVGTASPKKTRKAKIQHYFEVSAECVFLCTRRSTNKFYNHHMDLTTVWTNKRNEQEMYFQKENKKKQYMFKQT